jgi:ERCC4-type nuclease
MNNNDNKEGECDGDGGVATSNTCDVPAEKLAEFVHTRVSKKRRDITVIVDTKEKHKKRYELLTEILQIVNPDKTVHVVRRGLVSGDITFTDLAPDRLDRFDECTCRFPRIEVKTVDDMVSTIGSARDEQTDFMKHFVESSGNALYLIENTFETARIKNKIPAVYGRTISLLMRDGMNVAHTQGYNASAVFLANFVVALEFMEEKRFERQFAGDRIHTGPKTKKEATDSDFFVRLLCNTVNGVSQEIAEAIVMIFPSIDAYYNFYFERMAKDEDDEGTLRELLAKEIPYGKVNRPTSAEIFKRLAPHKIYAGLSSLHDEKKKKIKLDKE